MEKIKPCVTVSDINPSRLSDKDFENICKVAVGWILRIQSIVNQNLTVGNQVKLGGIDFEVTGLTGSPQLMYSIKRWRKRFDKKRKPRNVPGYVNPMFL